MTMRRLLAVPLCLSGLVVPLRLAGQVPTPAGSDILQLSPFVLRESADPGYAPAETLAGTRLRTRVSDVASAMTIVTPDLMRDLGASNYNDVLNFLPSTAVYVNLGSDDANSNGPRTGTPMTVRGYRSDSVSTNFFTSFTRPDAYNSSRMTFTRGPNSILFGIGNPGGAMDVTTNRADSLRRFATVEFRADSIGGRRGSLDANLPLAGTRAGLRVDLLHDDMGNFSRPARDRRDSAFVTSTWQAAPGTTVSVNFESTRQARQIPRPFETFDWTSTWLNAGRPIVPLAQRTTATSGVEFLASGGYPVQVPGVGALDWARMAYGARPLVRGARASVFSYGAGTPNRPIALTTYLAGDADRVNYDDVNGSVIVQHRIADGFNLELGAARDHNYRENFDGDGNGFALQVDANAQLPNGAPNPNVGRFYTEQWPKWEKGATDDNQVRASLSHERDLRSFRVLNRGLGRLVLAAMGNHEERRSRGVVLKEVNETPLPTSTADLGDSRNLIRRRTYLFEGNPDHFVSDYAPINENGIRSGWQQARAPGPRNDRTLIRSWSLAGQASLLDELAVVTGGLRRDESRITQSSFSKDARGVYVGYPDGGTPLPDANGVGRSHLLGLVLNPVPGFSLFGHRSTNFQPVSQPTRTFANEILPPVRGRGWDAGLRLGSGQGRFSASVGWFVTEQFNIKDTAVTRGQKATWINQIWDAIDAAQRVDPSASDVKAQRTRGVEVQLVANPSSNLRLMANFSRNFSELKGQGDYTFAYLAAQQARWQAQAGRPVASNDGRTVGDLIARIRQEQDDDQRIIGIEQIRYFRWQANLVGRYQFARSGPWGGFAAGGALRWRGAPVIGFARIGSLLNPDRPFLGRVASNLDTFAEYSPGATISGRRIRWLVQLRVQNVLDDRSLAPWIAEDDGTGHAVITQRLRPGGRHVVLASSFGF